MEGSEAATKYFYFTYKELKPQQKLAETRYWCHFYFTYKELKLVLRIVFFRA